MEQGMLLYMELTHTCLPELCLDWVLGPGLRVAVLPEILSQRNWVVGSQPPGSIKHDHDSEAQLRLPSTPWPVSSSSSRCPAYEALSDT